MLTALIHLLTPIIWISFGAALAAILITRRIAPDRCPDCQEFLADVPDTAEEPDTAIDPIPASAETDHGP